MSRVPSHPRDWSFFRLTREAVLRTPGAASPGVGVDPDAEVVRFRGHPSLAFPPRDLMSVEDQGERVEVEVSFGTLYGVDSPLPPHLTEDILRAARTPLRLGDDKNTRVRDFLDIFNHRLLSLLYRAWAQPRLSTRAGRWGEDDLSRQLDALVDLPELPEDLQHHRPKLLRAAGLFYQRPRSRSGLLKLLAWMLPGLPVRVVQGVPRDVQLATPQRSALGRESARLGSTWRLGRTVRGVDDGVLVEVAESAGYDMQPGGADRRLFELVVDAYIDQPVHCVLRVLDERPPGRPFVLGDPERSGRLGQDMQLRTPTPRRARA